MKKINNAIGTSYTKGSIMKNYTKLLFALCLIQAGTAFTEDSEGSKSDKPSEAKILFESFVRDVTEFLNDAPDWFVPAIGGALGGSFFGKAGAYGARLRAATAATAIVVALSEAMERQKAEAWEESDLERRVTDLECARRENANLPECFNPEATSGAERTPLERLEEPAEEEKPAKGKQPAKGK